MLSVTNELNTWIDMQNPAQHVQQWIPIWHHFGFRGPVKFRYGSKVFQCLMTNHEIETAGEAETAAKRVTSEAHKTRRDCKCCDCRVDRMQKNCKNPHKCALAAKVVLDFLTDKWGPRRPDTAEDMGLTEEEREQNLIAREENGMIHFDPGIDNDNTLTEGVKIF
ncbi:hypothetical protein IW261DRAFT_1288112, partial [Armillaria novae-zelandiae]